MGARAELNVLSLGNERVRVLLLRASEGDPIGRPPKLSADQIRSALRQFATGGVALKLLADRFDVSPLTLSRVMARVF
jgi:hypothetical protein